MSSGELDSGELDLSGPRCDPARIQRGLAVLLRHRKPQIAGEASSCLFAREETDLRGPLRAGASDAELGALITAAVAGKQAGHTIGAADFVQPARTMSAIGG